MFARPLVLDPCHEARLADAWAFLRGERRDFVAVDVELAATTAACEHRRHLLLRAGRLAVGVVLDDSEAIGIAADMLAMAPGSLDAAQVDDACVEACNVLAACMLSIAPSTAALVREPGPPSRLAAADYQAILGSGAQHRCYATLPDPGRVVVTLFELAMPDLPGEVRA